MTCTKVCEDYMKDVGIIGSHYCGKPAVYTHAENVHWCAKHYRKWMIKIEKNRKLKQNKQIV